MTVTISLRLFGPERQLVYLSHSAATAMRHGREIAGILAPGTGSTATGSTTTGSAAVSEAQSPDAPDIDPHRSESPGSASPSLDTPSRGNGPASVTDTLIAARGLSLTYPTGKKALQDIDLRLPTRGVIGLTGASGCGKSTLVSLMSGDLAPTSGSLTLSGRDIAGLPEADRVRLLTVVRGNDPLLSGTVRTALNPAGDDISDDRLRAALESVGLTDELAGRGGLETPVAPGGSNLSGGQRQRLSLARSPDAWSDSSVRSGRSNTGRSPAGSRSTSSPSPRWSARQSASCEQPGCQTACRMRRVRQASTPHAGPVRLARLGHRRRAPPARARPVLLWRAAVQPSDGLQHPA